VLSKEPSAEERAAAVVAKAARAAAIAAEEREASGVSVVTGDERPAGGSPLKLMSADSGACDTIAIWLSKCVFPSKAVNCGSKCTCLIAWRLGPRITSL
jgi:hypothetical protein